jgi:lactate permease
VSSTVYTFPWLSSPGTLLLICGFIVAAVYRVSFGRALRELAATAVKLRWAFLTVATVLALAYVMNLSGRRSPSASGSRAPGRRSRSSPPSSAGWAPR